MNETRDTFSYTMKGLDRGFWRRVKSKAALESLSVKALIEKLLRAWLGAV